MARIKLPKSPRASRIASKPEVKAAARRKKHQPRRLAASDHLVEAWDESMEQLRNLLGGGRSSFKGKPPYANWSGTLRRFLYELVRRLRTNNHLPIIVKIVGTLPYAPLKVSFANNPFYWALYAAKHDGEIDITNKEISRFAAQMLYADMHRINAELLVGFVYQQGDERALAEKLAAGRTEDWLW